MKAAELYMMQILGVIPQLRTTDLAASVRFYTATVGLTLAFQYEDFYAGIRAGALATALRARGVRLVKDVHDTAWGTREFAVHDDRGHTLYFGQAR